MMQQFYLSLLSQFLFMSTFNKTIIALLLEYGGKKSMCVFPDSQVIGCDEQMRPKIFGFARKDHIMSKAKQVSNISQLNIDYNI